MPEHEATEQTHVLVVVCVVEGNYILAAQLRVFCS